MEILKTCKQCGTEFIAHNPKACYCSSYCRNRHSKETIRKQAMASHKEELSRLDIMLAESSEVLKVRQVAAYLGVNKSTIYRYIKAGILPAVQFPGKTLVRKADLQKMFDSPPEFIPRAHRRPRSEKDQLPPATNQTAAPIQCIGYISVPDLAKKHHVTPNTVKKYLDKRGVPDMIYRTCRYYEAEKAEKAFRQWEKNEHPEIKEWYSVKEIQEKYDMDLRAIYNMVHDHDIPRRHLKNSMLYSKAHVDKLRAVPDDIKENYIPANELMAMYHMTYNQVHNRLNRHHITRKKIVRTLWVNKREFELSLHIE